MKKFFYPILIILFIFTGCSNLGLGDAVFNCSVCHAVYSDSYSADNCSMTRYCPGASKEEIKEKEDIIDEQKTGENIHYLPRLKGEGYGYRSYNYWTYYYTLKVSNKNLVYRVIYDEKFNDWSSTSSEEIRVTYGNDKVFNIFTSVVCVDPEQQIWVMKFVNMMDLAESYYTIIKETGENEFSSYGKFDALTDALDKSKNISAEQWTTIDYTGCMTADGMNLGANTIESYFTN